MEANRALILGLLLLLALPACKRKAPPKPPPKPEYVYPAGPGQPPVYRGPMVINQPPLRATPASHDFGRIFDEQTVTTRVAVTNPGKQRVMLIKVDTSCGCTAARPLAGGKPVDLPYALEPGARLELPISLDPRGRGGLQEQWVELRTNNATQPITRVKIGAEIKSEVTLESYLFFGALTRGKPASRTLLLEGFPGDRLRVTGAESTAPYVRVEVGAARPPKRAGDPVVYPIKITIAAGAPYGRIEQDVYIRTTSPRFPRKRVFVLAMIKGEIDVQPGRLRFAVTADKPHPARTIFLTSRTLRIEVRSVECDPPYLAWRLHPRRGNAQSVRVEVGRAPAGARGQVRGRILIKTNSKERPELTLPVVLDFGQATRD